MNGGDEIGVRRRAFAAPRRSTTSGMSAKADVERLEVVQILAAVQRGDGAMGNRPKQGKVELVDVEMQNVEFVGELPHPVEHQHVIRDRVPHVGIEAQRHGYARNHGWRSTRNRRSRTASRRDPA